MPFTLVWPFGIERALLAVFFLIGGFGIGAAFAAREFPLCWVAGVHAAAGALTVVAGDLITLLVAWELLTFSAFVVIRRGGIRTRPIVRKAVLAADGSPPRSEVESARAAYRYLAAQIAAAALFFVAIVVHAGEGGSLTVERLKAPAQPFMLLAILVKTAMMPLHGWLVGSYTQAGFVGSFVLSAYATKVGVFTAARLLSFAPYAVPVLSMIGAAVAVVAVLCALAQHSARRLLSYHIVSQVGYMLVGVGLVGTGAGTEGITAGLFHAVNHIIYKALLFLVVAVVADYLGHDDLRRMGRLARSMPFLFVCGVIGACAIVGLPFTSGYASKELLKQAGGEVQTTLLMVASVGTGLSFTKFIYLIFLRPSQKESGSSARRCERFQSGVRAAVPGGEIGRPRIALGVSIALATLASLSILIGVVPTIVPGVPPHPFYSRSAITSGAVPAALAVALWFVVRGPLLSRHGDDTREPLVQRALSAAVRPLGARLRRAYRVDAQLAIGIATASAVVLTLLLAGL